MSNPVATSWKRFNDAKEKMIVVGPKTVLIGQHFAVMVLKQDSYTEAGDERSRTNPGHGYPERTIQYSDNKLYVTKSEEDWKEFIAAFHVYNRKELDEMNPKLHLLAFSIDNWYNVKPETITHVYITK